jgi:predicted MFS family arabinose efflux permease
MSTHNTAYWRILTLGAAVLMITMGLRQSLGLFIAPITLSTGLGIAGVSFALAVGQFMWGASQPLFGLLSERIGTFKVMTLGALLIMLGLILAPLCTTTWALTLTLGVLVSAGAGAGSFAIMIAAASRALPPERRAFAAGFINAGGSFGQFLFAPLAQLLISGLGWMMALTTLAVTAACTIPLAFRFVQRATPVDTPTLNDNSRAPVRDALRNPSYLYLHAGYFTCGFHVAFLTTHLPGYAALCGLSQQVSAITLGLIGFANIFGSLLAGYLGGRMRMKWILVWMYGTRALMIGVFLLAPKTTLTFYVFGVAMGMTWLATVPPTAGLVGKLFGTRHLATLFGLTLLTHQIGAFFGAWLGGVVYAATGQYDGLWIADMALAGLAALINLPIKEALLPARVARV